MKSNKLLVLGRPNVGKSTFINKVIGTKRAITLDTPGVTRDIVEYLVELDGKSFTIMDSGGVFIHESHDIPLQSDIERKVRSAAEEAFGIIFLVDSKTGIMPTDEVIAHWLRPFSKKVVLAANKVDDPNQPEAIYQFEKLGYGAAQAVSSINGNGVDSVVLGFFDGLSDSPKSEPTDYKIAVVGRPNVGKSSLINALLNEDRMIVSPIAGTTRDSVDAYFNFKKKRYLFADTAGLRKKARVKDGIEFFSVLRTEQAIKDADLVIFVTDPEELACDQDKQILHILRKQVRNFIVFINKWDLTERTDEERKRLLKIGSQTLPFLEYYPCMTGSAKEKMNLTKLLDLIPEIIANGERRVGTGILNKFVAEVLTKNPPTAKFGQRVKIFYATQAEAHPPHFVFFVNHIQKVDDPYMRFCERRLREFLGGLLGVSIKISFKGRANRNEKRPGS